MHRLMATNRFPGVHQPGVPLPCVKRPAPAGDVTGSSVTVRENEHAIIETAYAKGWLHAAPAALPHRQERSRGGQRPLRAFRWPST